MMAKPCKVHSCPAVHSNLNGFCDRHQTLTAHRPCRIPGCSGFSEFKGLCRECAAFASKDYDKRRQAEHSANYDVDWRKKSKAYLVQHPECESCRQRGRVVDATLVHHILPIKQGGARLDDTNLQALCRTCHERHHGRQSRG